MQSHDSCSSSESEVSKSDDSNASDIATSKKRSMVMPLTMHMPEPGTNMDVSNVNLWSSSSENSESGEHSESSSSLDSATDSKPPASTAKTQAATIAKPPATPAEPPASASHVKTSIAKPAASLAKPPASASAAKTKAAASLAKPPASAAAAKTSIAKPAASLAKPPASASAAKTKAAKTKAARISISPSKHGEAPSDLVAEKDREIEMLRAALKEAEQKHQKQTHQDVVSAFVASTDKSRVRKQKQKKVQEHVQAKQKRKKTPRKKLILPTKRKQPMPQTSPRKNLDSPSIYQSTEGYDNLNLRDFSKWKEDNKNKLAGCIGKSAYEIYRIENVSKNSRRLKRLGLEKSKKQPSPLLAKKGNCSDSDYSEDVDAEEAANDAFARYFVPPIASRETEERMLSDDSSENDKDTDLVRILNHRKRCDTKRSPAELLAEFSSGERLWGKASTIFLDGKQVVEQYLKENDLEGSSFDPRPRQHNHDSTSNKSDNKSDASAERKLQCTHDLFELGRSYLTEENPRYFLPGMELFETHCRYV